MIRGSGPDRFAAPVPAENQDLCRRASCRRNFSPAPLSFMEAAGMDPCGDCRMVSLDVVGMSLFLPLQRSLLPGSCCFLFRPLPLASGFCLSFARCHPLRQGKKYTEGCALCEGRDRSSPLLLRWLIYTCWRSRV